MQQCGRISKRKAPKHAEPNKQTQRMHMLLFNETQEQVKLIYGTGKQNGLLPMAVGHEGITWGGGNVLCLAWGWLLHGFTRVLKVLILLKSVFFTIFKFYLYVIL